MGKPAARILDPTAHGSPLAPGPGSVNVLIGFKPAWRGIPLAAAAGVQAAQTAADTAMKVAESATKAAAGTPGAPAAYAAEQATKASLLASMSSLMSSFAGSSDIHICPVPTPVPPHGPGVVIDGSSTVLINNMPACTQGCTVLEALGGADKIAMGDPTVLIGDSGGGGGAGGGAAPVEKESFFGGLFAAIKKFIENLLGEERYSDGIVIKGDEEFRKKTRERLDELKATPTGKQILDKLDEQGRNGKGVTIKESDSNETSRDSPDAALAKEVSVDPVTGALTVTKPGDGTSSTVGFNPDYSPTYPDGSPCRSPAVGLCHELIHATHNGDGENLREHEDPSDPQGTSNHEEARTIGRGAYAGTSPTDNALRSDLGFKPRDSHSSVCP